MDQAMSGVLLSSAVSSRKNQEQREHEKDGHHMRDTTTTLTNKGCSQSVDCCVLRGM